MVIFLQLRRRHLPQKTKRQVTSCQQIDNPNCLPKVTDRRQLNSIKLKIDAACSWRDRWELQLWNGKRWSRSVAASGKLVWNQHYSHLESQSNVFFKEYLNLRKFGCTWRESSITIGGKCFWCWEKLFFWRSESSSRHIRHEKMVYVRWCKSM